jgi:hypothetical protein
MSIHPPRLDRIESLTVTERAAFHARVRIHNLISHLAVTQMLPTERFIEAAIAVSNGDHTPAALKRYQRTYNIMRTHQPHALDLLERYASMNPRR